MPARYEMNTLPDPAAEQVELRAAPPTRVAALTYRGNWSRERYLANEQTLRTRMAELELKSCGSAKFARHNPPFWPAFLRKNEILIPLCD